MNNALKKRIRQISTSIEYSNEVEKSPLVSVLVMTYNQEDTIAQCLDSIIAQKTNFDFEILVGEDKSQDKTLEICIDFAKKHPTKIRLFAHTGDDKIHINGRATGRFNLYTNLLNARGTFIAMCEGDDHWNGVEKLQKQVDAFQSDTSIGLCFHAVYINYFGKISTDEDDFTTRAFNRITDKSNITYKTFLEFGNFIHTPSVMYKKNGLIETLSQLDTMPGALDFLLHIIATKQMRAHKIEGRHATYRSGTGTWSSLPKWEKVKKWKVVLQSILGLDFLEPTEREKLSSRIDSIDADVHRLMQNWSRKDQIKYHLKRVILSRPVMKKAFLTYRKFRH